MTRENRGELADLTFIVKTFERFDCVKRLVRSIYRYYPDAKVLIADDGRASCKAYMEKKYARRELEVFELPYDVGLSAGRNYLLDRVKTKYFCLLDDDFVFDKKTDIGAAAAMMREKDVDILGGYIRNYSIPKTVKGRVKRQLKHILRKKPLYALHNYIGSLNLDADAHVLYCDYVTKQFPDYQVTDIVLNFFIGRTDAIRERNRWDDELKLQEHTAFFLMAKLHGLRVAFTNRFSVQHRPDKPEGYKEFRSRSYFEIFIQKMGIRLFVTTCDGGEKKVLQFDANAET